MATTIRGRDYEPDRIWSRARITHNLDISGYGTQASLESYISGIFKRDRYLGNLGREGREQVIAEAMKEWGKIPADVKLVPLMAMRERGLLTTYEFHELAEHQGFRAGQSEYRYRKWTGTQEAVWDLKYKGLLEYGEYSKLLKSKKISRGAGFYRYKKHLFLKYNIPYRDWAKRPPKFKKGRRAHP